EASVVAAEEVVRSVLLDAHRRRNATRGALTPGTPAHLIHRHVVACALLGGVGQSERRCKTCRPRSEDRHPRFPSIGHVDSFPLFRTNFRSSFDGRHCVTSQELAFHSKSREQLARGPGVCSTLLVAKVASGVQVRACFLVWKLLCIRDLGGTPERAKASSQTP